MDRWAQNYVPTLRAVLRMCRITARLSFGAWIHSRLCARLIQPTGAILLVLVVDGTVPDYAALIQATDRGQPI